MHVHTMHGTHNAMHVAGRREPPCRHRQSPHGLPASSTGLGVVSDHYGGLVMAAGHTPCPRYVLLETCGVLL